MATARDIITNALRDLGVLGRRQPANADDLDLGFVTLNEWVTDLDTQRATIFVVKREVFSLVANTTSYTIGPGGTFNTVRPVRIESVGIVTDRSLSPSFERPIGRPLSDQEYQRITNKSLTAPHPSNIYYDHGFEGTGLGRIIPWPIPTSSLCDVVLYIPRAMQEFADLSTDYAFPPGYERAIRSNLALDLAPAFEREPQQWLVERARASMASLKRANLRPRTLSLDPAVTMTGAPYNIWTDR